MSWIRTVPYEESSGELREFYDRQNERLGFWSNFHEALSLRPDALLALVDFIPLITSDKSSLGRRKQALIATTVSVLTGSRYSSLGHGERLRDLVGDLADAVKADWRQADLAPDERAMLEFCERVTLDQRHLAEQDVAKLRAVGFNDTQILEIVLGIAIRQFVNLAADALGVEPHFERKRA